MARTLFAGDASCDGTGCLPLLLRGCVLAWRSVLVFLPTLYHPRQDWTHFCPPCALSRPFVRELEPPRSLHRSGPRGFLFSTPLPLLNCTAHTALLMPPFLICPFRCHTAQLYFSLFERDGCEALRAALCQGPFPSWLPSLRFDSLLTAMHADPDSRAASCACESCAAHGVCLWPPLLAV